MRYVKYGQGLCAVDAKNTHMLDSKSLTYLLETHGKLHAPAKRAHFRVLKKIISPCTKKAWPVVPIVFGSDLCQSPRGINHNSICICGQDFFGGL